MQVGVSKWHRLSQGHVTDACSSIKTNDIELLYITQIVIQKLNNKKTGVGGSLVSRLQVGAAKKLKPSWQG